jgi:cation:H+ antiporter
VLLIGSIGLILLLSLILIKAADGLVISIKHLTKIFNISGFAIAAVILALATSLPELFVGVTSAVSSSTVLSFGNIVGANIANLSLIIGLAGVLGGTVIIKKDAHLSKELPLALMAGLLPIFLLWDRQLSRFDGVLLIAFYFIYASGLFHNGFKRIGKSHLHRDNAHGHIWHKLMRDVEVDLGGTRKELIRFLVSITALIISSYYLVNVASNLAQELHVPLFLIGLLVISIGTTLPELAFSFESIKEKEPTLLIGNVLGSVIANSTLILGIALLISPVSIAHRREYLFATISFILIVIVFYLFSRTKRKLERWEAGVLFLLYIIFVLVEISGFDPWRI